MDSIFCLLPVVNRLPCRLQTFGDVDTGDNKLDMGNGWLSVSRGHREHNVPYHLAMQRQCHAGPLGGPMGRAGLGSLPCELVIAMGTV